MDLTALLDRIIAAIMEFLPRIAGGCAILLVGWLAGRLLARGLAEVVKRTGMERAFGRTVLGRALERSGMPLSKMVSVLTKVIIYIVAIFLALDTMGLGVFSTLMRSLVEYIPHLAAGLLIIVIGFIVTDFVGDTFLALLEEMRVAFARALTAILQIILYFIVITVALTVMKVDVSLLQSFANIIAWGVSVGTAVGLGIAFGWGLKDIVARNAGKFFESTLSVTQRVEAGLKLKEYEKKIKELEDTVKRQEDMIKEMKARREVEFKELERVVSDLDKKLSDIVKDTGTVKFSYGAYRIEVKDPARFPWTEVIIVLSNNGFRVTLERVDEKYLIEARPYIGG
ncbi:MAG: hypothetical protein DRJ56_06210 [Thermoprotei archaeon]|nr:MAG: hypothetical protein DRJ56_06210 [Thermoprotei archaeon]